MSVRNYHYLLHHNPEWHSSQIPAFRSSVTRVIELCRTTGRLYDLITYFDILNQVLQVFDGESIQVRVRFVHLDCIHFLLCTDVFGQQINWLSCADVKYLVMKTTMMQILI